MVKLSHRPILPAPFPWFGGKSCVAHLVWRRFGPVRNYVEPFFGSGAMLLGRPKSAMPRGASAIETVNDLDGFVANFWRAVQHAPDEVAEHADNPPNENDLTARHIWLVTTGRKRLTRMEGDPDYYDAKVAGWWVWGVCCWIGGQFASGKGPWTSVDGKLVRLAGTGRGVSRKLVDMGGARGVNRKRVDLSSGGRGVSRKLIHLSGNQGVSRQRVDIRGGGRGVKRTRVDLSSGGKGVSRQLVNLCGGRGINRNRVNLSGNQGVTRQIVHLGCGGQGIHRKVVHSDIAGHGQCQASRENLVNWMRALADRLRLVRVCCGDWRRILGYSPTDCLGTTGVFLDPPYSSDASRDMNMYACDSGTVAHEVRDWCIEHGDNPDLRICLCGYEGEGHDQLVDHGWSVVAWETRGGYANIGHNRGTANKSRERLWFSPACLKRGGLWLLSSSKEKVGREEEVD